MQAKETWPYLMWRRDMEVRISLKQVFWGALSQQKRVIWKKKIFNNNTRKKSSSLSRIPDRQKKNFCEKLKPQTYTITLVQIFSNLKSIWILFKPEEQMQNCRSLQTMVSTSKNDISKIYKKILEDNFR